MWLALGKGERGSQAAKGCALEGFQTVGDFGGGRRRVEVSGVTRRQCLLGAGPGSYGCLAEIGTCRDGGRGTCQGR